MKYHLLYADETGESHWRDIEVPLEEKTFAPPAEAIELSGAEPLGVDAVAVSILPETLPSDDEVAVLVHPN